MLKETNTPTPPRIEPGSPDPESDALTIRPVRPVPKTTRYKNNELSHAHFAFSIFLAFSSINGQTLRQLVESKNELVHPDICHIINIPGDT